MRHSHSIWAATLLLLVLLSANTTISAEEPEPDTADGVFTLGDIVVSDEKEATQGTVDRVDEADLRRFNRDDLAEALNLMPGVSLSRVGARNERMVFVRGFDLKHVPLFMDGIPVYVMYDGYSDLGRFTTFDTSQIVLSKSAASVLYGPNTMGGAINVVSKRPQKPVEVTVGAGVADGDARSAYANVGSNQGKWYLQAGAGYSDRDYFTLSDDFTPTENEDGDKRENSYLTDQKVSFKVGFTPSSEDEYAVSYSKQEGEKGTPPYAGDDPSYRVRYWRWPQWDKESFYFNSKTAVGDKSYFKTRVYYDFYDNSLFSYDDASYTTQDQRSSFKSWYNDETVGGSVEMGTTLIRRNEIKLALHYKKDQHKEHDNQEPRRTFQDEYYSVGLENTIALAERWDVVVGASCDWQFALKAEDYDGDTGIISGFPTRDATAFNPQASLYYYLSDTDTAYATIARKSRFPTMKDRYSYRMGYGLPNTRLDPEYATNYEIGYNRRSNRLSVEGALFFSDVEDYILQAAVADPDDPGATVQQNQNVGEVYLFGGEGRVMSQITENLDGGLGYTYTQWDNRSNPDKITGIPAHKITAFVHYLLWRRVGLTVDAEHAAGRYSDSTGVRETESYTVANCKLALTLLNGLKIEGGVKNLLDENYEVEEGYPEAGVSYFANLTYRY